jgi:hypothetical protein
VALSEKYRSRFYEHFVEHVGEEAAEAMLAQFPSRDADEPATKDFVGTQVATVRAEMAQLRVEMAELRVDLVQQMADVRVDLLHQMAELRADFDRRTDRLMNRMQIVAGLGFGFLAVVLVVAR